MNDPSGNISDMVAERFVGGMNIPLQVGGRLNATWPLAVLAVDARRVLRGRGWLGRLRPLSVGFALDEISMAYPLRGRLVAPGVGMDLTDGRTVYFWSWRAGGRVLEALGRLGVDVAAKPRRAGEVWPWRPRR